MKILFSVFSCWTHKISVSGLAIFLVIGFYLYSPEPLQAQQGVAPTALPAGGCAIDGNLLSRIPATTPFSSNNGDFLPNDGAEGNGGYIFTIGGIPLDTTTALHLIDGYDAADPGIFTGGSKFSNNPNSWKWKKGNPPSKDDINHSMLFFSFDSMGDLWFIGNGDRKNTNGNTYLDFELLQNSLYKNSDGTFTSQGPDGGRTIGDLAITIIYTNGGTNPQLLIYRWNSTGEGNFSYVLVKPAEGRTFLATNKDSAIVVPYGAFGYNNYPTSAFTEVACKLNHLVDGSSYCLHIKTVVVKTKASHSINAELKDFIDPVQINISSAPVVKVNSPTICDGDSAIVSATILSGGGPFSYHWNTGDSTQSIKVSPDTTMQYTVVVTGANGCPSELETSTVTVLPLPVVSITGSDSICPWGSGQFFGPDSLSSYAWTIIGNGTIKGIASERMVFIQGNGACDSSFSLKLVVTDSLGCSNWMSRTIKLLDHVSPILDGIPADTAICCADSITLPANVTAFDNCNGSLTIKFTEVVSDSTGVNKFILTRTWTTKDSCNNIATANQVIMVNDTIHRGKAFYKFTSVETNVIRNLNITPNPFISSTKIQFIISEDALTSVELYNSMGVKIKSLYNDHVSAGTNILLQLLPDASMGKGLYLLVLRANHDTQYRRVILTR